MKIYTNWAFLRPVNTSLHGDFTIENPSFSMYLLSTQEHTIPLCIKILQILFRLELSWFWIEGNGRFWDFLTFYVPLCSKKLSVHWLATAYFLQTQPLRWYIFILEKFLVIWLKFRYQVINCPNFYPTRLFKPTHLIGTWEYILQKEICPNMNSWYSAWRLIFVKIGGH